MVSLVCVLGRRVPSIDVISNIFILFLERDENVFVLQFLMFQGGHLIVIPKKKYQVAIWIKFSKSVPIAKVWYYIQVHI